VSEKDSEFIDIAFANPPSMNPAYAEATSKPAYIGPPVDITVNVVEGPGLWHFLDLFGRPRSPEVAPVRGLVVDVVEKEYGGGAKKLPAEILDAFFAMLANPNSQAMELIHLTVQNIYCRKSMDSLGIAVSLMGNLHSVELFSNGLKDGDVEDFMFACAKNSSLKKIMVSGQALSGPARDQIELAVKQQRPDIDIKLFS